MKRKGAVPIPYIIALLLGISVVAILGFWFFVLSSDVTLENCRTKARTYCTSWKAIGYSGTNKPNIGWYETQYPRCEPFADDLGFPESEEDGGHDSGDVNRAKDACIDILGEATTSTTTRAE